MGKKYNNIHLTKNKMYVNNGKMENPSKTVNIR